MPDALTKGHRQQLRELVAGAYAKELALALRELRGTFQRWHSGEINTFDLDNEIHTYHNEVARDLYKKYNYGKPETLVAVAVCDGILSEEELGEDLFSQLSETITAIREARKSYEQRMMKQEAEE